MDDFFLQPEIIASGSLSNVTDINNSSMLMQVKSNSILINILTVWCGRFYDALKGKLVASGTILTDWSCRRLRRIKSRDSFD